MRAAVVTLAAALCTVGIIGDSRAQVELSTPTARPVFPPPVADDKVPKLDSPLDKLIAALETRGNYDWKELTPAQLGKSISELHKVPLVVDEAKIEEAGKTEIQITYRRDNVRLDSALSSALRDTELRLASDSRIFYLTSAEDAKTKLFTLTYWVRDLLPIATDYSPRFEGDFEELIDMIVTSAEPATWDSVGGPGTIQEFGDDLLVVSQTLEVHLHIRRSLSLIREARRRDHARDYSQMSLSFPSPREAELRKRLDQQIDMAVKDQPLEGTLRDLARRHELHVEFDTAPLEAAGRDLSHHVSLELKDVSLRQAISLLLAPRGMAFVTRGESLLVTTKEHSRTALTTRLYPVGDLVSVQSVDGSAGDDPESLIELITTTVEPQTWDSTGGPGAIKYLEVGRSLVFSQIEEVHDQTEKLLSDVRKLRAASEKLAKPTEAPAAAQHAATQALRSFTLEPVRGDMKQHTKEVAEVVMELVSPSSWKDEGVYLRSLNGILVVRHRADVQRQVAKTLTDMGVWTPPDSSGASLPRGRQIPHVQ